MRAVNVRNRIIKGLTEYLGVMVYPADRVDPEAEFPYIVYSILSPYIHGNTLGHFDSGRDRNGNAFLRRSEQAGMSLSFTVCSMNRTDEDKRYILGDDEALDLAEKAQGWFLFTGKDYLTPEIVVESVENVAQRSVLVVAEVANRYGFDVTVTYIREDMRCVKEIEKTTAKTKGDQDERCNCGCNCGYKAGSG